MSEDSCVLAIATGLLTVTHNQIEVKLLDVWRCKQSQTKRRYSEGL
jgi:hypothetical protein